MFLVAMIVLSLAPTPRSLSLRSEFSDAFSVAQTSLRPGLFLAQPAPATPRSPSPDASSAGAAREPAQDACDIDCDTAHEDERAARYALRSRARSLRRHRALAIATWSTMLVTEVFGTIQAVNQDTWFGRGNCASDPRAFACEQYSLVQGIHETFAFTTTGLYALTAAFAIGAPDPDNASEGDGTAERTLRLHKALAYVHGVGMVLLPLLGILSVRPQLVGITDNAAIADFGRAVRSVHTVLGFTTFAALTFSGALELF